MMLSRFFKGLFFILKSLAIFLLGLLFLVFRLRVLNIKKKSSYCILYIYSMVVILDGNSETGAHVWRGSGSLTCFVQIDSSRECKIFLLKRPVFLHTCATYSVLPSNTSTIIRTNNT